MDADETAEFDVGEIVPANQVPKVTLADLGVGGERVEVEELGPGRGGCCGTTAANPSVGRFC
jgi:hypothetical protein